MENRGDQSVALTEAEWAGYRKDIDRTVQDFGQCFILTDGNFEPICQLPAIVEGTGGETRFDSAELSVVIPAMTSDGEPHTAVDALVDSGFGRTDETSRLVPVMDESRFVVVQRAGGRRCYKVVFPRLLIEDGETSQLRIEGVSLVTLLQQWPCPSVPVLWGHEPIRDWEEDAGGKYGRTYRYGPIEMATVAHGYTAHGPAVPTIRKVVQESLDAGNRAQGWDRPHMVVDMAPVADTSPVVAIRRVDNTIWDTIITPARLAGVDVRVDLWWPGDVPVQVDYESAGKRVTGDWSGGQVLVVRVEQRGA